MDSKRVTICDGGVALNSTLQRMYPMNQKMRCQRHLLQDLNNAGRSGRPAIPTLREIGHLPRAEIATATREAINPCEPSSCSGAKQVSEPESDGPRC
eukprot:2084375-Pleurochrysis_carterae.AAC.1